MNHLLKKYGLALKVLVIVAVVIGVKLLLHYFSIEYIEMNSLFTTVVGGAMFLIGFILAGTIADYKESEKFPSEVAAALENLYQEGEYVKRVKPEFNLDAHHSRLHAIIVELEHDLDKSPKHKKSLEAVQGLSDSMIEMDKLGASASVARIRAEQGNLNKSFLRAFQIKETNFIPGAYAIAEIIAGFVILFILFMKADKLAITLAIFAVVIYIFIYMVLFIKDIDDPFEEGGYADVDMFLIKNFKEKVAGHHGK